ncbi:MAG: HSP20 family protein [Flavobacteriales bacterium]|mgnify:FL=1|jgi:HSP20 family protein
MIIKFKNNDKIYNNLKQNNMKIAQHNFMPNLNAIIDDVMGSETFESVKRNLISNTPLANIFETETAHVIELAIPGIKKEDVTIDLHENKLTIALVKKENSIEKTILKERKEFNYSKFSRAFNLPKNIDFEKIEAKNENGILSIIIPKKEEEIKKNRTITIK